MCVCFRFTRFKGHRAQVKNLCLLFERTVRYVTVVRKYIMHTGLVVQCMLVRFKKETMLCGEEKRGDADHAE